MPSKILGLLILQNTLQIGHLHNLAPKQRHPHLLQNLQNSLVKYYVVAFDLVEIAYELIDLLFAYL